jgi:hypothetical protein
MSISSPHYSYPSLIQNSHDDGGSAALRVIFMVLCLWEIMYHVARYLLKIGLAQYPDQVLDSYFTLERWKQKGWYSRAQQQSYEQYVGWSQTYSPSTRTILGCIIPPFHLRHWKRNITSIQSMDECFQFWQTPHSWKRSARHPRQSWMTLVGIKCNDHHYELMV